MDIEKLSQIAGALVTLLSALSSLVNHVIRKRQAEGFEVSPLMLGAGAVLNVGAVNLDKAAQLAKMLKAPKASADADTATTSTRQG